VHITMGRGLRPETHTDQGTMQASVMRAVGPPSVLQLETDFPKPTRCAASSSAIVGYMPPCAPLHAHA
jgi:hypothetical protein